MGALVQEGLGGHHEAGSAEPALGSALFDVGFLDGMKFLTAPAEPLHSGDFPSLGFLGQRETAQNSLSVDIHRAAAASTHVASPPGSHQIEVLAEDVQEDVIRPDGRGVHLAVDFEINDDSRGMGHE
jgi:hypothetical protein